MSAKYALNVDIIMLIMSSLLVVSAALNEKIVFSALTFKTKASAPAPAPPAGTDVVGEGTEGVEQARRRGVRVATAPASTSGLTLGMSANGVRTFDTIMGMLGAAAVGSYGLSLVYKKKGNVASPKSPGVYTAVFGFAVALSMVLSGLVGHGIHKEVAIFKEDKEKGSKVASDVSIAFTVLGSIALVLMVVLVIKKAKGSGGGFRFAGGGMRGGNAVSTFFTY